LILAGDAVARRAAEKGPRPMKNENKKMGAGWVGGRVGCANFDITVHLNVALNRLAKLAYKKACGKGGAR